MSNRTSPFAPRGKGPSIQQFGGKEKNARARALPNRMSGCNGALRKREFTQASQRVRFGPQRKIFWLSYR